MVLASERAEKVPLDGLVIDRDSPMPLYFQIAQQLEQAISAGTLPAGARLDNEIELAEQLAVSRPTLRKAIETLVRQGLVVRRRGLGTVVVARPVRRPLALTSLYDDLSSAGRRPTTEVLALRREPADAQVATMLGLPEGDEVITVERLRRADGEPLALMRNHLPPALVTVDADGLARYGLYQLLRRQGVTLQLANQEVSARPATGREAKLLAVPRGTTVLTMRRTAYDSAGRAVEYGSHCYIAERYAFEMTLVAR
ncbi:GntR family transcriptional regulator [Micromonospora sp. NPDC049559]|uniref:GntR family transcriptional regulator n=1 Tax=Micromonospora sp. NPDC049559 TaxID=3155923 RepID=UPI0034411790